MKTSQLLWQGKPSQWVNMPVFIACMAIELLIIPLSMYLKHHYHAEFASIYHLLKATVLVLPLLVVAKQWLITSARSYQLTEDRFTETYGVFTKVTNSAQLYRVNDTACFEPFFQRLAGLGVVVLYTNDATSPVIVIEAVPNVQQLHEMIRSLAEKARERKNIFYADQ
jgi:uncharacterized membrane protein YdbT with pleckstrin-like domain